MTFLNPTLALVGLACIAIPIAIHLLMRRRRRPVPWGAMKFLMQAYAQQRRRLRLEQFLLLATRCLLIGLLAMAFGRPLLGGESWLAARAPRTLYILLDNSVTTTARGPAGAEFIALRDRAESLLRALEPDKGDRAALITLAAPPEALVLPAAIDAAAVARVVSELTPQDAPADLPAAVALLRDALSKPEAGESEPVVALLSPWRQGSADPRRALAPLAASSPAIRVLASAPAESTLSNYGIESAVPLRRVVVSTGAGSTADAQVRLTLRRSGPAVGGASEVPVVLTAVTPGTADAGAAPTRAFVRFDPGQDTAQATVAVPVPNAGSLGAALVARLDPDPLDADNTARAPLVTRERLTTIILAPRGESPTDRPLTVDQFRPADWLSLALAPEAATATGDAGDLRVRRVDPAALATTDLQGADALLIPRPDLLDAQAWGLARAFLDAGGVTVVFPPADLTLHTWPDAMNAALGVTWTFPREPVSSDPPLSLRPAVESPAQLFALVGPELTELAKPVMVRRSLPATPAAAADARELLGLSDGTAMSLMWSGAARGLFVYVSVAPDLNWTNLPAMPLMVPFMQELVRQGVGQALGAASTLAGQPVRTPAFTAQLRTLDGATAVDPDAASRRADLYTASDTLGAPLGLVAVNADASACDTTTQTKSALEAYLSALCGPNRFSWLGPADPAPTTSPDRRVLDARPPSPPIDLPLLAASVLVALIELVLARRFGHAHRPAAAPPILAAAAQTHQPAPSPPVVEQDAA